MNPNYCHTITVYNRLQAKDTASKKDEWYKTVLPNCSWRCTSADEQKNDQSNITNRTAAETYTIRIPQNPNFRYYNDWKQSPDSHFTVSKTDIIILGECAEEITGVSPNTASEVMQRYKPNAFLIKSFTDNTAHLLGKHYKVGG